MTTINMDDVVHILTTELDVPAVLEDTSSGCWTIYAGDNTPGQSEGYTVWEAVAGPGWVEGDTAYGDYTDFYVGIDDEGQTMPISVGDFVNTARGVALLIAAQTKQHRVLTETAAQELDLLDEAIS